MKISYYNYNDTKKYAPPLPEICTHFHELTIVLDGEMTYTIGNIRYALRNGDIIFIKRGTTRARDAVSNTTYVSYNFQEENFNSLPTLMDEAYTATIAYIVAAFNETRKNTYDLSDIRFSFLFRCLIEELRAYIAEKQELALVKQIKRYIREHLQEKISLLDISKHTFFSVSHIEKKFKQETGSTIINYLIQQRLLVAQNLLLDATLDLSSVAEQSGFPDYNFFSRSFTRHFNISPSAYRKKHAVLFQKKR